MGLPPKPKSTPHKLSLHLQGGLDVLLYGDSLFESFRQKRLGFARSEFVDNYVAWTDLIQSQYRAASYSIAGKGSQLPCCLVGRAVRQAYWAPQVRTPETNNTPGRARLQGTEPLTSSTGSKTARGQRG